MMNTDQIAAEAAKKINDDFAVLTERQIKNIVKSAIEKATESLRQDLALAQQMVETRLTFLNSATNGGE